MESAKIDQFTREGDLYSHEEDNSVRCHACAHRCLIRAGKRGICQVRFNENGILRVPWGYVAGAQVDPIEKKPFNHFLPGSQVLTFGMLGCNFHCAFCQNWVTSQALRDPRTGRYLNQIMHVRPEELVAAALQAGAEVIASSYNEPTITAEWAGAIFQEAKKHNLKTVCVSNGYATPETLGYLRPWLDGYKIDLKSMQDKRYREMGGVRSHVLEAIRTARDLGLWVEVVTLVIPGFNDSVEELWQISSFLAGISADIPWHVTAYHPDYLMDSAPATPASTLQRAAEIGEEAGLHFVYAGNLPGRVGSLEDTRCPHCGHVLIARQGYWIKQKRVQSDGTCPDCGEKIPGVWG